MSCNTCSTASLTPAANTRSPEFREPGEWRTVARRHRARIDLAAPTALRQRRTHPDLFPAGGAAASSFIPLAERITDATVYGVQYPGRQDRIGDPLIPSIPMLAERIAAAIITLPDPRPALFGHSMGATLAYETARALRERGHGVKALIVSGRPDPTYVDTGRLHTVADAVVLDELARLSENAAAIQVLRGEPDLAALVLPAVRADYQAVETYRHRPGPPLDCDITALLGDRDPTTDAEQIHRWSEHTVGGFTVHCFPGGHFYLDAHRDAVARLLATTLELART